MRSTFSTSAHARRNAKNTLSIFFVVLLAWGLVPTAALAAQTNPLSIPEGSEGVSRIASSAEGGVPEMFSHCSSEDTPSADAGSVNNSPREGNEYINELTPLVATARGYVEVELSDPAEEEIAVKTPSEDSVVSFEQRASSYAEAKTYQVLFDANGSSEYTAPIFNASHKAAFGGPMPSIEGYLAHEIMDGRDVAVYPKREKYVFMGWYDGSDWRSATKYYDRDFKAVAGATYPYAADGLVLYAGWAPVLSYKVPTSVSIALGTEPELNEPTVAQERIVNDSPWPIRCTTITWDAEELGASPDQILAAEEQINGLLAKSVELTSSSLGRMFAPLELVYLDMSVDGASASVTPNNTASASFTVAPESTVDATYAISLAEEASIIGTEMMSRTTLLTPFEAVLENADGTDASDPVRSAILFDAGEGTGGQCSSLQAVKGEAIPELSDKSAPLYEGRDFMGWYDSPDWKSAKRYYDEKGDSVRGEDGLPIAWDKDSDTVLCAGWRAKGCPVRFVAGGEASLDYWSPVAFRDYGVPYGQTLGSIEGFGGQLPEPYWTGYAFIGWFYDDGREAKPTDVMTAYESGALTILTGRWSGVPVTVTWDSQGGTSVDAWEDFPSGSALSVRGDLPVTTRAGYTFSGWFESSYGGSQVMPSTVVSASCVFYARWAANTIVLSWNVDGAVTTTTVSYADNLTVVVPPSLAMPSKGADWQFRFWAHGDGSELQPATPLPTENTTYYAKWRARISFDVDGGSFAGSDPSGFVACGDVTPMLTDPTRPGYVFDGWYAAGVKLEAGSTVTAPATYVARWVPESFTISYDLDGGTVIPAGANPGTYTAETATFKLVAPAKTGYEFTGWSGTDLTGDANLDVTIPRGSTGDRSYKAHWSPQSYTITWHTDGHGSAPVKTGYSYGETYALPTLSATGYTFGGWYTDSALTAAATDVTATTTGDMELWAKWTPVSYSIIYDLNSGTNDAANPTTYTVETNDINLKNPTRKGYTFNGWFATSVFTAGTQVTKIPRGSHQNYMLYAKWTATEYTIVYTLNSGTNNTANPSKYTIETSDITLKDPTRTGYNFTGWTGSNGTTAQKNLKITTKGDTTGNLSYAANWSIITYTITWNANNGTWTGSKTTQTTSVNYGAAITKYGTDPTRTGYTFQGWGGSATATSDATLPSSTTSNATYYARWAINKYTISYSPNGGTRGDVPLDTKVDYNTNYTVTDKKPTRVGYTFKGWTTASDSVSVTHASGASYGKVTGDVTFYAVWEAKGPVPSGGQSESAAGSFYIYVKNDLTGGTSDTFAGVALDNVEVPKGYYTAEDIKKAANDIAANGSNSKFYKPYYLIMSKMTDVKMDKTKAVYGYSKGWGSSRGANTMSYFFRIIGINHDNRVSNSTVQDASGSNKSVSKAGLTFQFVGAMHDTAPMNSSDSNDGGWGSSAMRASMNSGVIKGYAPSAITNKWVQVKKEYGATYNSTSTNVSISNDYMFLASYYELCNSVYSSWSSNAWLAKEGVQYEFYEGCGSINNSSPNPILVKYQQNSATGYVSSADWWWERSCFPSDPRYFLTVGNTGYPHSLTIASTNTLVVPCFCF